MYVDCNTSFFHGEIMENQDWYPWKKQYMQILRFANLKKKITFFLQNLLVHDYENHYVNSFLKKG